MAFPVDDLRYGGQYAGHGSHGLISWPTSEYYAVTPDDNALIDGGASGPCVALHLAVGGDLEVLCPRTGNVVIIPGLAAGWHAVRTTKVLATNTTATGIVAAF